jgi:hypothetical protein
MAVYRAKRWTELLTQIKKETCPDANFDKECLIWTGAQNDAGYGIASFRNKKERVHRISFMIANDIDILQKVNPDGEKLEIRHLCNIPLCIEPTHLRLGTPSENGKDKVSNIFTKARGETHYNTSLSSETALAIKQSKGAKTQKDRAKEFGVSINIIRDIDAGTTWAHINGVNGNTFDASAKMKAMKKKRRDFKKQEPWSEYDWDKAKAKLNNSNYTKRHLTRSFEGVHCLEWIRANEFGYGKMYIGGRKTGAHIIACAINNNCKFDIGKQAAHKCGFNLCVEPSHLYFATASENTADKFKHGTMVTKLNEHQVLEIRRLAQNNIPQKELSEKYGMSDTQISRIVNRISWKHI